MKIYPVIMCGGSGTRLWPLSRADAPKQFIRVFGDAEPTLFESALDRLREEDGFQSPVIVSNEAHRFWVAEGLAATRLDPTIILLEPSARNTAPAIAAAAAALSEIDPEAIMAVMPSDHIVRDVAAFSEAVKAAAVAAEKGRLVLIGVTPTEPHTGYGYLKPGDFVMEGAPARTVVEFREKPTPPVANMLFASAEYLWNGGFFIMRAATYLQELDRFEPDIHRGAVAAVRAARSDLGFHLLDAAAFDRCRSISIDYAVMERTDLAAVVEADIGWSDVGSWASVAAIGGPDADGNVAVGDALMTSTTNSFVHASDRLVATLGLDNVVVVSAGDAVLVADLGRSQEVGSLAAALKLMRRPEAEMHRRRREPWGFSERLSLGGRFQVHLLHVKPGGSLPLQMHRRRSEHWVVVRGAAQVKLDADERLLRESESFCVHAGQWRRLANPGEESLELIEVRTGSGLAEDDVVAFDEAYDQSRLEWTAPFAHAPGMES